MSSQAATESSTVKRAAGSERRAALAERVDRATELPMLALAVVFLLVVATPEFVDVSASVDATLETATQAIWIVFAVELAVKTYLAPDRRHYLTAHWLDVAAVVLPFLRPLRIIAVGGRFWRHASTLLRRRTLALVGTAGLLSVWIGAGLMYAAERGGDGPIQTFPDALLWAAATITTVGYGDVYPKTPAGRVIAVALMLVGISLFGLLTARVAAFFVEDDAQQADGSTREILERLERIERHIAPGGSDAIDESAHRAEGGGQVAGIRRDSR